MSIYYRNKIESLHHIFGTKDIQLFENSLRAGSKEYRIFDDVILLDEDSPGPRTGFAEDIQFTFGAEWQKHCAILPEHLPEFNQYFDLVDLTSLAKGRVCDLGCGSGRWSYFLKDRCRELILVDFSDAIFVARHNLREADHCLFFKGDLTRLPFAPDFADFLYCLGVLHHLPMPCLDVVKSLKKYAPRLLIFLYYSLDNRPPYFRVMLRWVTAARIQLARVRSTAFRSAISLLGAVFLYRPLIVLGHILRPFGLGHFVPLYEFYRGKSLTRIQQDVYDRFFTRIEQRVSREQINDLNADFAEVRISEHLPYWHFLLIR